MARQENIKSAIFRSGMLPFRTFEVISEMIQILQFTNQGQLHSSQPA